MQQPRVPGLDATTLAMWGSAMRRNASRPPPPPSPGSPGEQPSASPVERTQVASALLTDSQLVLDSETGFKRAQVLVGGSESDALAKMVRLAFLDVVRCYLSNPEFGGEVRFVFVPELTPPGSHLSTLVSTLLWELNQVIRQKGLRCASGRPLRLVFQYGR